MSNERVALNVLRILKMGGYSDNKSEFVEKQLKTKVKKEKQKK